MWVTSVAAGGKHSRRGCEVDFSATAATPQKWEWEGALFSENVYFYIQHVIVYLNTDFSKRKKCLLLNSF